MKKCIICGKLIEDDIYYCPYCGEFNSCSGLTLKDIFNAELDEQCQATE